MSENTFKYKDKRYRFSMEGEHVVVIELHHDGKWWPQCQVVGLARPGIIALLRRDTARADMFARLMEVAREEIDNSEDAISHQSGTKILDALQMEWDGETERGEG